MREGGLSPCIIWCFVCIIREKNFCYVTNICDFDVFVSLDSALAEWTVTKTFVVPVSSDTQAVDYIRCELAEDTLTYRENLSSDDSTVSKKLSRNAAKYVTGIEEAFRDSCEGCPKDIARTYSDPYWRPFAEMVISPCRIRPQIEPVE